MTLSAFLMSGWGFGVGKVGIRYYVVRATGKHGRRFGYWAPCLKRRSKITGEIEPTLMAKLGFALIDCGEDGPAAWTIAEQWNAKWDAAYALHLAGGGEADTSQPPYPPGSLGEAFIRLRETEGWKRKKPGTQADWMRGWSYIDPWFGKVAPSIIEFEHLDAWYARELAERGEREAHRGMKIWRALWQQSVAVFKTASGETYGGRDLSIGIRRKTPAPRNAIWTYDEAVRLVKRAWRMGYRGLAAALAVAWDTSLSPVDVRTLTSAQLTGDAEGPFFSVSRAKTGKAAIGTLGPRTQILLKAYRATLPPNLLPSAPIFYTRGGQPGPKGGRPRPPAPYTKDTLGDDFRVVRAAEFPGDKRKVMDFRRSGAVEAMAGQVDPAALAGKMANTIDQNKELQATYLPHSASLVRLADAARTQGRSRLKGEKGGK